jgi:hypothetical protein
MKFTRLIVDYTENDLTIRFADSTDMNEAHRLIVGLLSNEIKSDMDQEIIRLLKAGLIIDAIKYHREKTGSYLKDAKDYVCALRDKERIPRPNNNWER